MRRTSSIFWVAPRTSSDVTNCATRLRVNVKDETLVADDANFRAIGAHGIAKNGKNMQVIIGLSVPKVRDAFEQLLK